MVFRKIYKRDDSDFIDEKKNYYEENYKIKSEEKSKVNDVKKIEIKLRTTKLSNSNKYVDIDLKDEVTMKAKKFFMEETKEDNDTKKKCESSKLGYTENKTSGPSKQFKSRDETDTNDISETERYKKHQSDADKKNAYSKRTENYRQDSKTDRRIRNKDRPAIEIYRPGMGRLNKLKEDSNVDSDPKK